MTIPDFGSERPGPASSTRTMIERHRADSELGDGSVHISGRAFWIALGVILLALAVVALVLAL
jgi:hypothetical protein